MNPAVGGDTVDDVDVTNEGRITFDRDLFVPDKEGYVPERIDIFTNLPAGIYGGRYDPAVTVLVLVQRLMRGANNKRYKTLVAKFAQLFVVPGTPVVRRWQVELPAVNQVNGRLIIRAMLVRANGRVIQTTGYPNP